MKVNLRSAHVSLALAISTAAVLIAAELPVIPRGSGLTVHEWGTFTSVAGEDGAAIEWDVLGGNNDLPRFVYERSFRCSKFQLSGTVRMETPVLYFYSPEALNARVRVAFPKGMITEWYPAAEQQVDQQSPSGGPLYRLPPNMSGIDTSLRSVTGGIEWTNVKIEPGTMPKLVQEKSPSHYYAARETDATPVKVGDQHEKFLFYRGVGRFPVPVSARVAADGKVIAANLGSDPVPSVMFFENRGGRIGYRNAGVLTGSVTLDRPSLDGSLAGMYADLENALVAEGLFRKEAHAMVETWKDSWFEEGSRLIYIVPSRAVDAILPLEMDPAPVQTARVFVGRIELITAETKRAVEEALTANDRSVIQRYARFLDPILKRIAQEQPSLAGRCDRLRAEMRNAFFAANCR